MFEHNESGAYLMPVVRHIMGMPVGIYGVRELVVKAWTGELLYLEFYDEKQIGGEGNEGTR